MSRLTFWFTSFYQKTLNFHFLLECNRSTSLGLKNTYERSWAHYTRGRLSGRDVWTPLQTSNRSSIGPPGPGPGEVEPNHEFALFIQAYPICSSYSRYQSRRVHQPNAHTTQPLKLRFDYNNNTTWGNKLYIRTPRSIPYNLWSSGDFSSTLKKCQFLVF
jgi:hypothetical protein